MSLIKTIRNRTKAATTAKRLADRFAANTPSQAATIAGHNLVTVGGRTMRAAGVTGAIGDPVAIYNSGSPGMAEYSAAGAGLAIQYAGGGSGSGSGGGMEAHEMAGPYHTGTIADAQAPQFLKTDGTRALTGNLTVAAGILIDGIDVGTPGAGLSIISNSYALAASVAGAGLTYNAGVLAVDVANTGPAGLSVEANAVRLTTSAAPGQAAAVLASDATGGLTLAGEITITGASTSPALHLAAGSTDTRIWQNGANLQVDVEGLAGALYLSQAGALTVTNKVTTPLIDTPSAITIQASAGSITLDPQSAALPAGSYLKDLGAYNRKWRGLYVAELIAETLVAQDIVSTIGGRIMVAPTTTLIADVTAGAGTIDVKHNFLTSGTFVMFQTAPAGIPQFEVMKITSAGSAITGGYRYSVTRAEDGTPANAWSAGDAAVSLGGSAGQGYIDLTSTSTIHSHNGPTITIYARTGSTTWDQVKAVATMGNLRSFVGYGADEYGQAAGNDLTLEPSTGFKGYTIDRTNGLRLFSTAIDLYNGATKTVHISPTGADIWIGPSTADRRLSWDGSTLTINGAVNVTGGNAATQTYASSQASAAQAGAQAYTDANAANKALSNITRALVSETLITGGNIRVGSGTKDSNLYGWHIDQTEIVGQNGTGNDEVTLGTDGKIKAGAGAVTLSRTGIQIKSYSGGLTDPEAKNRIDFYDSAGIYSTGYVGAKESLNNNILRIYQGPEGGQNTIQIVADSYASWWGTIEITGKNSNLGQSKTMTWDSRSAAPTYAGSEMWHDGNAHARGGTWTAQQAISVAGTQPLIVYLQESGANRSLLLSTTGSLATTTQNDYMGIWHLADNIFALGAADSNNWQTIAVQPYGGGMTIGKTAAAAATLDIARGTLSNGALRIAGTDYYTYFNYSTAEDTYIRAGKTAATIHLNDAHAGPVTIAAGGGDVRIGTTSASPFAQRVYVNGGVHATGIITVDQYYQGAILGSAPAYGTGYCRLYGLYIGSGKIQFRIRWQYIDGGNTTNGDAAIYTSP